MEDCQKFVATLSETLRTRNKEEMVQIIQSVWVTISLKQLNTIIRSMLERMKAIFSTKGGSTKW